jgi:hypothetical protein
VTGSIGLAGSRSNLNGRLSAALPYHVRRRVAIVTKQDYPCMQIVSEPSLVRRMPLRAVRQNIHGRDERDTHFSFTYGFQH